MEWKPLVSLSVQLWNGIHRTGLQAAVELDFRECEAHVRLADRQNGSDTRPPPKRSRSTSWLSHTLRTPLERELELELELE